jgi:hypothetical protein
VVSKPQIRPNGCITGLLKVYCSPARINAVISAFSLLNVLNGYRHTTNRESQIQNLDPGKKSGLRAKACGANV